MSDGESEAAAEYRSRLRQLTEYVSPFVVSYAGEQVLEAAEDLATLSTVDRQSLTDWISSRPRDGYTLGLAVGLSQEKLKNKVQARFGTASWAKAARDDPGAVIDWMDDTFDLVNVLEQQLGVSYSFGDVLVARGSSKTVAGQAATAGRLIEDAVEAVVRDLGLPYEMRGRFVGRNGDTGPADLAIPNFQDAKITVACKGFDSTGSKLTAAVTEVETMAQVRFADQYVFGVVDGIGWNLRQADFRRMYALFETGRVDGLYTLEDLDVFRADLRKAAQRVGLLP